jgi:hypothetical protein
MHHATMLMQFVNQKNEKEAYKTLLKLLLVVVHWASYGRQISNGENSCIYKHGVIHQ